MNGLPERFRKPYEKIKILIAEAARRSRSVGVCLSDRNGSLIASAGNMTDDGEMRTLEVLNVMRESGDREFVQTTLAGTTFGTLVFERVYFVVFDSELSEDEIQNAVTDSIKNLERVFEDVLRTAEPSDENDDMPPPSSEGSNSPMPSLWKVID